MTCELSGWGPGYGVNQSQGSVYYTRALPRNQTPSVPKVAYQLAVPTGGVTVTDGPFAAAFATNLQYLDQLPVDDMLYWFRRRAGVPNGLGATSWGWDGKVEPGSSGITGLGPNPGVDAPMHAAPRAAALGVADGVGGGADLPRAAIPSGECNPGGDPTSTINGQWKQPHDTAVFTVSPPTADGEFTVTGPGWVATPHGQVDANGSFSLFFPAGNRSSGRFTNASSWKTICWWTAVEWVEPPPGGVVGEVWCKIGSRGCTAPPGPPPSPAVPPGRNVDGPYGLRGSVAGAFMMGSGGAVRWADLPDLRARLALVVGNISQLQASDGFAMAFPQNETNNHENPNYVQSWLTHGLLEAEAAGMAGAASVLRKHFDWFNYATDVLARMLPPQPAMPGAPTCSQGQASAGHCVYLIYQGMIHNTRVATSSVGTARDIQVVQDLYQEDWFLDGLAARNTSVIWRRRGSHNYEITAFEAYLDLYVLTGDARYLHAMEGAWNLMRNYWIHVGGSIALNEGGSGVYPPGSYFLGDHPTGELCGSSFWIRFNQRFHRLRPGEEVYPAEMERSLINVILANQAPVDADPPGIRYFAQLEGSKAAPTNVVTCCESQGTRTYGALPEFVFSTSPNGTVYINQFVPSLFHGHGFTLLLATGFPGNGSLSLTLQRSAGFGGLAPPPPLVMLRIPSWSARKLVPVVISGPSLSLANQTLPGRPGTYLAVPLGHGQVANADLGMGLRVSVYNGTTAHDPFRCNSPGVVRAAVEWGPVLLAALYSTESRCLPRAHEVSGPWAPAVTIIGIDPRVGDPSSWLTLLRRDDRGDPVFAVKGTERCTLLRPYYGLRNETMSVYPNYVTSAGLDQRGQCAITAEKTHGANVTSTVCLACPAGQRVAAVDRAQFGVMAGNCSAGIPRPLRCAADPAVVARVVENRCLGTKGCSVPVDADLFDQGKAPCPGAPPEGRSLGVMVRCEPEQCDVAVEDWPKDTDAVRVGCPAGSVVGAVPYAEFGVVAGNCTAGLHVTRCAANSSLVRQVVAGLCVGRESCAVAADSRLFGDDPCPGTVKQLAVKVGCAVRRAGSN